MNHIIPFITKHLLICGAFIVALALWINFEIRQKVNGTTNLSPQEMVYLMNQQDATVIDLRDKELFQQGHITGATNKSIEKLEGDSFKLSKDKPIILVCKDSLSSSKAANKLRKNGYENVYILKEGIAGWQNANFPLI